MTEFSPISDKPQALKQIKGLIDQFSIQETEISSLYRTTTPSRISNYFSILGGIFIIAGLIALAVNLWNFMPNYAQVATTLGAGLVSYLGGALFHRDSNKRTLSIGLFLIAAIMVPIGVGVCQNIIKVNFSDINIAIITTGFIFIFYLLSTLCFQEQLFLIFSLLAGTGLWALCGEKFFSISEHKHYIEYFSMLTGALYIALGYFLNKSTYHFTSGLLYFFGAVILLTAICVMTEWTFMLHPLWEAIYLIAALGIIILSMICRSRALLWIGSLGLVVHLIRITTELANEFFAPMVIIATGIVMLLMGYFVIKLDKRLITKEPSHE